MHRLPFNAQITDKLFELVQQSNIEESYAARGYLPSLTWTQQYRDLLGLGSWEWLVMWIPNNGLEPGRVFNIDGVAFFISPDAESALRGRVLDWNDQKGVVSQDASTYREPV